MKACLKYINVFGNMSACSAPQDTLTDINNWLCSLNFSCITSISVHFSGILSGVPEIVKVGYFKTAIRLTLTYIYVDLA